MPTVLITGCNRGIGLELARQYAAAGWEVHATTRTPGQPGPLGEVPGAVHLHLLDVRDRAQSSRAHIEGAVALPTTELQAMTQQFIDRFRFKASKARQVQSRIKQLKKMEIIELEDSEGQISFRFPPSPPSGRLAIGCRSHTATSASSTAPNIVRLMPSE